MKNFYKKSGPLSILMLFFLAACSASSPRLTGGRDSAADRSGGDSREKDSDYYDRRAESDRDRDSVIDRHKAEDKECSEDKECRDLCDEIYSRRRYAEECEKLSAAKAAALKDIHEMMEDASLEDLRTIRAGEFDLYANISIEPLTRRLRRYRRHQSREALAWIAGDPEITRIFQKEDRDFDLLKSLLKPLGGDEGGLKANIQSGDTFFDLIAASENHRAGEWLHVFIEDEVCGGSVETASCLETYCEIGDSMSRDSSAAMLDFKYFRNYLQEIIDEEINSDNWNIRDLEDVDELSEDWSDDLC